MKALSKLFAAALVLLAVTVVFSPLVAALVGTAVEASSAVTFAGFANFHGLTGALSGSALTALISALTALILGAPFALLVERSQPKLRRLFWTFGLLVLMVPPYIVAEAWIVLLGPAGKISRPLAMLMGWEPHTTNPFELARYAVPGFVYTWPTAGVIMGGCFFPIVALAVATLTGERITACLNPARIAQGMRGVYEIAARVLTLPALGAGLLVFAVTLTEFAVPQLLRVRTIGEAVYDRIQEGDVAAAAALSLPLLPLVVVAGAVGVIIIARSRVASMAGMEGEVPKFTGRLAGRAGEIAAGIMTLMAIASSLILPITSLTWLAVTAKLPPESTIGTHKLLRASGFVNSLRGAWELAHDDAVRTVLLASLAATLATVFAIALARLAPRIGMGPLLGVLGAGLAVPAPIVGLGLITIWNRGWGMAVYQGSAIVLLAWFARFLPVAVFLVQGALARVPRELEDAAALAGRGPLERMFSVVLPNAAPGLVAAWLAIYVLSATEFSATVLIAPPGMPLLAPSVINLMRRGQDAEIAACQFLLLGVVALPVAVLALGVLLRSGVWADKKAPPEAPRKGTP